MKATIKKSTLKLLVLSGLTLSLLGSAQAQTTAFTFQGRLNDANGPATGNYDMTFTVWNAATAGTQIAGPLTNSAVAVGNGLFTVSLNFGSGIFTGTNYWVEMSVCTNGAGAFATLAPRQQLTPAPTAFSLSSASPQASALCPAGSVMAYMGTTAPPGWLLCSGQSVSRTTYSSLFAVIGTSSGAGDGSTTFTIPDLRGRFLRGVDGGTGRDPDAVSRTAMTQGGNTGNAVGTVQSNATGKNGLALAGTTTFASATHTHTAGSYLALISMSSSYLFMNKSTHTWTTTSYNNMPTAVNDSYVTSLGSATTIDGNSGSPSSSAAVSLSNGDNETRPINAYVNYIIKY